MMRACKIAMVAACPFPAPRGTPIRIYRMADALSRRGHEVHVVAYHLGAGGDDAPFPIHRTPDVRTYRKFSPGPTYQKLLVVDPLLAATLQKVLRTGGFDIIHAHHYEGLLASLLARRTTRHPVVFDVHTLLETELPHYGLGLFGWSKRRIGRFLDARLPGRAEQVIAVTEDIRAKLLGHGAAAPENITVIGNGVECEHFDVAPRAGTADGKDTKTRTLIFTGNLASYQGIDLLLAAFRDLRNKRQDVRLLVVSKDAFDPYEPLARQLGIREYIDFAPARFDTLPELLAAADVAVNPRTKCDGIPQKLFNYMAAGKAIVSFAGSAKSLVHGELGLIVPDGDCAGFCEAALRLLDDSELASKLGGNAKRFAKTELAWEKAAQKTEEVYERVLRARSTGSANAFPSSRKRDDANESR